MEHAWLRDILYMNMRIQVLSISVSAIVIACNTTKVLTTKIDATSHKLWWNGLKQPSAQQYRFGNNQPQDNRLLLSWSVLQSQVTQTKFFLWVCKVVFSEFFLFPPVTDLPVSYELK